MLVSTSIAALLLTFLIVRGGINPLESFQSLGALPLGIYFLTLGMHVFTYTMRAVRLNVLLPSAVRPGFRRALMVSAAHNMASYLLPAKTGEASLIVYLKMHSRAGGSAGLAALLVARILDGATLCLGLAAACWWLQRSGEYDSLQWLGTAAAGLVGAAVVFLALSFRGDFLIRLVEGALHLFGLHRLALGRRILERTNALALALREAGRAGRLSVATLVSLPQWCSIFGFYYVLSGALGMSLSYAQVTFGAALAFMCNLLPINGGAGMGTQELGWVAGFHQFLGIDYDVALSVGLSVHIVQLFNIVAMGLIAHFAMGIAPRFELREPQ